MNAVGQKPRTTPNAMATIVPLDFFIARA